MNERPTPEDAQQSLRDHVHRKAREARAKCPGTIDRIAMLRLLEDRTVVRYPLGVRFDSEPLNHGEFACLEALGERPEDGFCLFIHPMFEPVHDLLPLLIAYYIPSVNYGDVATHVEAELFGATLLGLDIEEYYRILCSVADSAAGKIS
jgi:hypothetical protein